MEQIKISESDSQLAKFLRALGNPVRLSILRTLMEKSLCPNGCNPCSCGEKCEKKNCKCGCKCGELVDSLPVSQSTVSQHIKELKNAGLIEIKGRKGDYVLNHDILKIGLNSLLEFARYEIENIPAYKKCECC